MGADKDVEHDEGQQSPNSVAFGEYLAMLGAEVRREVYLEAAREAPSTGAAGQEMQVPVAGPGTRVFGTAHSESAANALAAQFRREEPRSEHEQHA